MELYESYISVKLNFLPNHTASACGEKASLVSLPCSTGVLLFVIRSIFHSLELLLDLQN